MERHEKEQATYFEAFAHPLRIVILRLLLTHQKLHVQDLFQQVQWTTMPTLHRQLAHLREAGIVRFSHGSDEGREGRRDGNYHYYFLVEPERVERTLMSWEQTETPN